MGLTVFKEMLYKEGNLQGKMGNSKCVKEIMFITILVMIVGFLIAVSFDFRNFDISMPILYAGGDDYSVYKNAKMLDENTGWVFETERLGAPYGAKYLDFMPDSLMNVDNLLIKVMGIFTSDVVTNVNLTVFFLFFLIAGTAYYCLRKMGVRGEFAITGAVVFDFIYYHYVRLIGHFSLSAYEFVPLSVLLCIWLWQDDRIFDGGRQFFKYKKNYIILLFSLLIANNGIAYYPFFTCLFLGITGVSKAIKEKRLRPLAKMFGMIASVAVFMLISLVPCLVYQFRNGSLLTYRSVLDSELYAMKIIQLLVPYKDYGIKKMQEFHEEYNNVFVFTEAHASYLGLVAGLGFLFLLFYVFCKKHEKNNFTNILLLLCELNLFAVLFATVGGFSSIFSNFVTGLIRGVNRVSIFIAFFGIAALCIFMTDFIKGRRKKWVKAVGCILFAAIVVLGLYDQIPGEITGNSVAFAAEKKSDSEFIQRIEGEVAKGAMIYQLPYHPYPEGGPVNNMADYHLLVGFLYSDTLRWSYGGSKGREGDLWNQSVSALPPDQMVTSVKEKGFAGIYIDKRAYNDAEFGNLISTLNSCIGKEPILSENGNLYFYKF